MNEYKDFRIIYIDDEYIIFTNEKKLYIYDISNGNKNIINVSSAFNIVRNKNQLIVQTYKNKLFIIMLNVLEITELPKPVSIPVLDHALIADDQNILTYAMNNFLLYKHGKGKWEEYDLTKGYITSIKYYKDNKVLIKYFDEKPSCELIMFDLNNFEKKVIKQLNCFHLYYCDGIYIETDTPMELSVYINDDFLNPVRKIYFERGETIADVYIRNKNVYISVRWHNRLRLIEYDFMNNIQTVLITGEDVSDIHYSYGSGNLFITWSKESKTMLSHFKVSLDELKAGKYKIYKESSCDKIYLTELDD